MHSHTYITLLVHTSRCQLDTLQKGIHVDFIKNIDNPFPYSFQQDGLTILYIYV